MIRLCRGKFIPETEIICDECGKIMECVPISISFGYGHYLDNIIAHFCGDKCLLSYLRKEQKKNKKDERFILGKEKRGNK